VNLDAVLRIKAQATGAEGIAKLRQGLDGAASGADRATGAFSKLKGIGGMVGGVLRQLAPALTVAGFAAFAKGVIDSADALGKMRDRTGVSVNMLDKFRQAANLSDTSLEGVEKGLTTLTRSMNSAANGTGAQAEMFKRLGIEIKDQDGNLRNVGDVFLDLSDALKGLPNETERLAAAQVLLRGSGSELLPMLLMGKDAILDFKSAMTDEVADASSAFKDNIDSAKEAIGQFAVQILLDSGVIKGLEKLSENVKEAAVSFSQMDPAMRGLVAGAIAVGIGLTVFVGALGLLVGVAAKAVAGLKLLTGAIKGMLISAKAGTVFAGLGKAIGVVAVAIKAFLVGAAAFLTWPVLLVAALVAAAVAIFVFRDKIWEGLQAAAAAIGDWVKSLWDWGEPIREFWSGLWDSIKDLAMGFVDWLSSGFNDVILEPIKGALSGLVEIFQTAWTAVKDWLGNFLSSIGQMFIERYVQPIAPALGAILDFFQTAWTAVKDWINGFLTTLGELFYQLYIEPIEKALDAIQGFFQTAWTAVKDWINGFLTTLGELFYQLYIEPIEKALDAIQGFFQTAWTAVQSWFSDFLSALGQLFYQLYIEPIENALDAIQGFFQTAWTAVQNWLGNFFNSLQQMFVERYVQPLASALGSILDFFQSAWASVQSWLSNFWDSLGEFFNDRFIKPIDEALKSIPGMFQAAWSGLVTFFDQQVIQPLTTAWNNFMESLGQAWTAISDAFQSAVVDPIKSAWQSLQDWLSGIVQGAASAVSNAFQSIAGGILGAFRGIVGTVGRIINSIIDAINRFIQGVNTIRNAVGLSSFSTISNVSIPTFAKGGFVKRATLAVVGEGGEPEYIVPESKMAAASANYLAGARGDSVLAAGPAVMAAAAPSAVAGGTGGPAQINITTGPVLEFEGRRYVTVEDLQSAARQTATQIYATLRTPAGRRAIGVA
jgi:phage-related protein